MTHKIDRRRVEMSELRKLFVVSRLLASRAQQSGDETLKELGQLLDKELDQMRDAAIRNPVESKAVQIEENHHAG